MTNKIYYIIYRINPDSLPVLHVSSMTELSQKEWVKTYINGASNAINGEPIQVISDGELSMLSINI